MNEMRGKQGIMVDTRFYEDVLVPLFDALGWKARRHTDPPEDATIIMDVFELVLHGAALAEPMVFVDPAVVLKAVDALQAICERAQADPNRGLPEWIDLRTHSQGPADGNFFPGSVYEKKEDWRKPSEIPTSVRQKAEETAKTEVREPVEEIFDFAKFRADPEESLLLAHYEDLKLTVRSKDMVDVGKEAFQERGWIYCGEHYGDGSITVQVVLGAYGKIVPCSVVVKVLRNLHILTGENFQETDLEQDLESGEVEEIIPFDDIPKILSEREEESLIAANDARIVKEAAEKEEELPPAALVLAEGEKLGIRADFSKRPGRFDMIFEIGANVVSVDCNPGQVLEFLEDCSSISRNTLFVKAGNDDEKETEENGKTSEADGDTSE